jgi:tyramine---L-glutamate ligase
MLSAVVADFRRMPGVEIVTLLDDDARFGDVAAGCDAVLVIAPEFDDLLLRRSQTVLDLGVRLLGSSPEAIRLTADKLATAGCWQEHGVPHPRTVWHDLIAAIPFAPPLVLKPRHGAGSLATFLVRDAAEMPRMMAEARVEWPDGEFIVQQYVEGAAASVALLISPTQSVALLPARQHLSNDGRFRYEGGSLPLPEPLAIRARTLAQRAVAGITGLQGYVGVDLVLSDGGDYAIEINPRLTTSYIGLRRRCRQNLAEEMLRIMRGESIGPLTWIDGDVQFHVGVTP